MYRPVREARVNLTDYIDDRLSASANRDTLRSNGSLRMVREPREIGDAARPSRDIPRNDGGL